MSVNASDNGNVRSFCAFCGKPILPKAKFCSYKGLEFYVGTSRAKQCLDYVVCMNPDEYPEVISQIDSDAPIKKNNPELMREVMSQLFASDMIVH